MSFAERVAENPGGFLLAFLVWIPLAAWMVGTIWWMVEGDIDTMFGFLSLGIALVIGYFTADPPAPWMAPLLFCIAVVTLAAVPSVVAGQRRRAVAALDLDQIRESYGAVEARPDNLGALVRMARFLYDRGLQGHAIVLLDQAVARLPSAALQEEQRTLHVWKLHPPHPAAYGPLPCLRCGHRNEAGRIHCERCHARFLLDHAERRWLPSGLGVQRILLAWVIAALLLVCIPATAVAPIPVGAVVALILIELAIGGIVIIRALREEPSGARS